MADEQFSQLQSLINWRDFFQRTDQINHQNNPVIQGIVEENQPSHTVYHIQPTEEIVSNNRPTQHESIQSPFGLTGQQIHEMDYIISMAFSQTRWLKKKSLAKLQKNFKTKKVQETSQCSICLEDMKKNSRVPKLICKHEFHKKCLNSWMKKKQSCPLCRLCLN